VRGSIRVAIALGSNLGDRAAHLTFAADCLATLVTDVRVSSFHETDPVGVAAQPRFLNAALTGETTLSAGELLDGLLAIEAERGRERPSPGAARTLDLDLILFGDAVIEAPGLQVPHPRFRQREFVLAPLNEIAPDWRDPVSGKTVAELLEGLRSSFGSSFPVR
jgi:2-amino-4-hydroxy-6-hydroxymethyldihydropteridine diphosphokinase